MSRIFAAIILTLTGFTIYAQNKVDVVHYTYEIHLSDSSDKIIGVATIYFKAQEPTEYLELDLTGIKNGGKGMKITDLNTPLALDIRITASPVHISYTHQNDRIRVKLPHKLNAGESDTIAIEYQGIPADGLIISKNKFGNRTFFADNWPNRGHNWIPCNDDPADKASVEFIVTAPKHYQVIANGVQIEETDLPDNKKLTHWKEDVPISTKVMVIGVAEFAVQLSGVIDNCIPVYSWVYPEERKNGFYDYAQANEILPFYIKFIGPYAYKKLANVESKTRYGGLENANTIFYSENSIHGNRESESLLAHEIAHQWFGNVATEKTFAHLWLSEGFATYMTILYFENKYGKDTALHMLLEDRDQVISYGKTTANPVVNNTPDYMRLLNPNSYQKGGWILHMLRRQLGDSIFWQCIRTYYADYAGKTADTDDLRKIFESVSGKNLQQYFSQWLFSPVNPSLKITWQYQPATKDLVVNVEQLQNETVFSLPLEMEIDFSDGKKLFKTINIDSRQQKFTIPVGARPLSIYLDPNTSLLFEGTISEIK
jgi:aminopeptidase N